VQTTPDSTQPAQDPEQHLAPDADQDEDASDAPAQQESPAPNAETTAQDAAGDAQTEETSQPEAQPNDDADEAVEVETVNDGTPGESFETQSVEADEAANKNEAVLTTASTTNDPLSKNQWELDSIHAREAWDLKKTNQSVTVAILDSGCLVSHEDLKANVVDPYNVYTGTTNVDPSGDVDSNHGTHVAGTIAGVSNNGVGISGVSYNARVMPVRVADNSGLATTQTLIKGFNYVLQK
jgi:subtilisin family serine protease